MQIIGRADSSLAALLVSVPAGSNGWASQRTGAGTGKVGYLYLHSAIDDHSGWPTPKPSTTDRLDTPKTEKQVTAWKFRLSKRK